MSIQSIKNFVKEHSLLFTIAGIMKGYKIILSDYPFTSNPRYGHGKPPHPLLYDQINKNRELYKDTLKSFLTFEEDLLKIPENQANGQEPYWLNKFMHPLDGVALYSFLRQYKPDKYFEVGSGNSTKFARKAITDDKLSTKILSIDPVPRAEVESICDTCIREPLENVDVELFDQLGANDILFIDNSHRSYMNSDVTTVFLDVLPRLKSGVLVQFHDFFLPYDYYPHWKNLYFNEQYLLACYMLSGSEKIKIILPNYFISQDDELINILESFWNNNKIKNVVKLESEAKRMGKGGHSFWIQIL